MQRNYQFISFEKDGDTFCVRLQQPHVEDFDLENLSAELGRLLDEESCRKMILNLGPEDPQCLFSILLAKLINLHRRLENAGGRLALAHLSEDTRGVFRAAGIEKFFHFYPDQQTALQALRTHP